MGILVVFVSHESSFWMDYRGNSCESKWCLRGQSKGFFEIHCCAGTSLCFGRYSFGCLCLGGSYRSGLWWCNFLGIVCGFGWNDETYADTSIVIVVVIVVIVIGRFCERFCGIQECQNSELVESCGRMDLCRDIRGNVDKVLSFSIQIIIII